MDLKDQDQWILDSGDSQHVNNNLHILYKRYNIQETMEMEN